MKRGVVITLVSAALGAAGAATAFAAAPTPGLPGGATTLPPTSAAATPTTAAAAATATVASAAVATTIATAADSGTLPEPASEDVDPVRTLVPRIVSSPAVLSTTDDRITAIDRALADSSTVVAGEGAPGTLCAVVPVSAPLMADGRWERNGEPFASTGEVRREPPGYGDCLPNADGEPFGDGVYQYVAVGPTGARSAAATIVIGVAPLDVWLLNNGDEPVCMVHASPRPADFYEAFVASSPLEPGEAMTIRVADVDQDLRVYGCPPDEVLRTFRISPSPQTYVALFEGSDDTETTAAPTGNGGTTIPGRPPGPTTAPTSAAAPTTTAA